MLAKVKGRGKFDTRLRCSGATPKSPAQGSITKDISLNSDAGGDGVVEAKQRLQTIADDKTNGGADDLGIAVSDRVRDGVDALKSMFNSMGGGEINVSAYDTAWIALVKDVNGSGGPQFPSSLQWIVDNQLPDGSWGDGQLFSAYDRLLNTLACVVALKSWNIRPDKYEKGLKFLKENISKLEKENAEASEQMLTGFEVVFLSLVDIARGLDIHIISLDSPVFQDLTARRNLKFAKIPMDLMHNVPTSLLYSLEGFAELELDWEKLLKLQSRGGSFLSSPASTALALMQTKDKNCLEYLNDVVQKFNGGAPCQYPVEIFERIWVIDRLQRLGISRYFQLEIKDCLDYVSKYWTQYGCSWEKDSRMCDLDDTCMAFRILRLHGYHVSPEAFRHFENGGEFFCFPYQTTQSVTVNFNLYRATQVMFPGEKILEEAKQFSLNYLREKQAANKFLDKWVILKDLPGEVEYALAVPWFASLPRVETRFYIEQYGGDNDVWIAKTFYRMGYVNNNVNLEVAKLDFNNCQALHRIEWQAMQKWFVESKFCDFGASKNPLLIAYFLAASNIFEQERSVERLAWAKTTFLMEVIGSLFHDEVNSRDQRGAFIQEFKTINAKFGEGHIHGRKIEAKGLKNNLITILFTTLNQLSLEAMVACGRDINPYLRHSWEKWMMMWEQEGDMYKGAAELLVNTVNLCSGRLFSNDTLSHPNYERLVTLSNKVCHQLGNTLGGNHNEDSDIKDTKIEIAMQELVQLVHQNSSDDISTDSKQTFFAVVRSFYYAAHCDQGTINSHIVKVLFESVV